MTEEGINIMLHPPYSPDLAPCDYWLNDYIKRNLIDQPNEKSLARAVSKVVKNIPEEEYKKEPHQHPRPRIKQEVSPHHSGNRSASAHRGHLRIQIECQMRQRRP